MKISKTWTTHIKSDKDKKEFEELVKQSKPVLDRLRELLTKEVNSLDTELDSYKFLLLPNTKERLVHCTAKRKKLKEIIKLIEV